MGDWVTMDAADGSGTFKVYRAEPEGTPKAAVIAIQEIFGVNAGMRQICDALAADGYLALSPDLFWRIEPGVDITDQTQAEWDKAFSLFNAFNVDKGIEDIRTTIDAARAVTASGKVGCVGYCLGGKLAYLTACRTDIDASVGYYAVGVADMISEAAKITNPLLLHIAGEDEFVPKDQQAAMHSALDEHSHVTLFDYPGADHAFARPNGIHWREGDAIAANSRTAAFLSAHLG